MTAEQFVFWLQGFTEMQGSDEPPTKEQWKLIKAHLNTIFNKVTPPFNPPISNTPVVRLLRDAAEEKPSTIKPTYVDPYTYDPLRQIPMPGWGEYNPYIKPTLIC